MTAAQPDTQRGIERLVESCFAASRRQTIEECVKVIERYGLEQMDTSVKDYPATVVAAALVFRIRALNVSRADGEING
jgi:hypothetical protein